MFWRDGLNAFEGEFQVRDGRYEDVQLTSKLGRIPQYAWDGVKLAIEHVNSGAPDAYEQAVEALQSVSTGVIADWRPHEVGSEPDIPRETGDSGV